MISTLAILIALVTMASQVSAMKKEGEVQAEVEQPQKMRGDYLSHYLSQFGKVEPACVQSAELRANPGSGILTTKKLNFKLTYNNYNKINIIIEIPIIPT
jgi:hypothetical protein